MLGHPAPHPAVALTRPPCMPDSQTPLALGRGHAWRAAAGASRGPAAAPVDVLVGLVREASRGAALTLSQVTNEPEAFFAWMNTTVTWLTRTSITVHQTWGSPADIF